MPSDFDLTKLGPHPALSQDHGYYYGGPYYIGPTLHTKTYMFVYFYY